MDSNSSYKVRNRASLEKQWASALKMYPPRKNLNRSELASGSTDPPPLYRYGFPFKTDYALRYAVKNHLTIKNCFDDCGELFQDKDVLDFADLTDEHFADPEVAMYLTYFAREAMKSHLGRKCKFSFDSGRPFGLDWDGIVSLWSNHDIEERFRWCGDYDKVISILEKEMNAEGVQEEGVRSELFWYLDWRNDVRPDW